jgi:hypothetical protein
MCMVVYVRATQASLGEKVEDGRTQLVLSNNGQKFVLASLLANKSEHAVMELMFEAGHLEFSVNGKNAVHLAGNMMEEEDEMDEHDMDDDMDDEMDDDEDDDDEAPPARSAPKGGKPQAQAAKKAQPQIEDEVRGYYFHA